MPIPFGLPTPDPGFEISIASRGMSQGIAQTDGIQVIPRALVRIGAVQFGGQWRNVSSPNASGVAAFFMRISRSAGRARIDLGAAYRIRTGARANLDSRAWEFSAGARAVFGRSTLRLSAEYCPREFENGPSLYLEGGAAFRLGAATNASVNLGRRQRAGGPDYATFNAGVTRALGQRLSLDARFYETNRGALGARYRGRIILSARLAF